VTSITDFKQNSHQRLELQCTTSMAITELDQVISLRSHLLLHSSSDSSLVRKLTRIFSR